MSREEDKATERGEWLMKLRGDVDGIHLQTPRLCIMRLALQSARKNTDH
jgi:hypothetical protein